MIVVHGCANGRVRRTHSGSRRSRESESRGRPSRLGPEVQRWIGHSFYVVSASVLGHRVSSSVGEVGKDDGATVPVIP